MLWLTSCEEASVNAQTTRVSNIIRILFEYLFLTLQPFF